MPFEVLKKTDVFYTLTGKTAETDAAVGVRGHGSLCTKQGCHTLLI